jgi:benzodiazapine receptor
MGDMNNKDRYMGELASPGQLRMSYLRWALLTVPGIVLLGLLSAFFAQSGDDNPWFAILVKPAIMPPSWAFPVAWTTLYILMGLAFAMILNARRAKGRSIAIIFFLGQLGLNLSWSPIFFGQHKIMLAFGVIVAMFAWAAIATAIFWNIRRAAGWLMLPYLAWLVFAAALNWQYHVLNPSNGALAGPPGATQININ